MPSALSAATDSKPTVLIVDDESAPRAALTQILRQDFHILTAENARTAMAVLNNHGVDLVTLDLRLPDGSGSELLDEIKRTHAEIEVIMVTAIGSDVASGWAPGSAKITAASSPRCKTTEMGSP